MANWLTYRIRVGDDVLVLADEEAQERIKNETERSKKADAQTASFLESTTTNGIIRNSKSDPFGQTAIGGMKVVIDKGDLIIKGNIKNHARLTRTYNVTQENRTEVFLYRYDSVTNEITGLWRDCIIQGDIILSREDKTELPLRSSGYYDILICKITIPAGATEITQDMIGDFRQNEYYCGYAKNILVEIDDTLTKSAAAADAAAVGTVISNLKKETRTRDIITEKRITNLEAGLPAERWSVDDSVAYIKEVPENALPFASVDMIGGMTRKCTNILPSGVLYTWGCECSTESDGRIMYKRIGVGGVSYFDSEYTYLDANNTYSISVTATHFKHAFIIKEGGGATDDNLIYGNIAYTPAESGRYYVRTYLSDELADGTTGHAYLWINAGAEQLHYEPYFAGLRSAPVTEVESVGVNLIPFPYTIVDGGGVGGVTWKSQDDGAIVFNGSWVFDYTNNVIFTTDIPLKAGTHHISNSAIGDGGLYVILQYTNSGGTLSYVYSGNSFTIETDTTVSVMFQIQPHTTFSNKKIYPILNKGTTASPYTPYRRNTLPIPAEVQALDGYGWGVNYAVYNYIDLEKKQFVKRVGRVDLGTLDWVLNYGVYFTTNIPGKAKGIRNFVVQNGEISPTYNGDFDDTFQYGTWGGDLAGSYVIYKAFNGEYADVTAFKAAMSGVMLYYELAEPVITDISDLLPDDNLIGVEGGGTVTMVNEYGYDVPSEITYQLKGAEA